jgi:short-subunit dehydrogenase
MLKGRTALVTGASSGIGPHIARHLHLEGVHLVLSARREDLLSELARELFGSRVVVADLGRREDVESLAAEAGEVGILVANAGIGSTGTVRRMDPATIDSMLEVNLRAPIMLSRLLLPGMVERGEGQVVLMASMAGQVTGAGAALYSATKSGLRAFGHALRDEVAGRGVGVSLISPYYVSEEGLFARAGGHAPGAVSPSRVARAVVEAIRNDRGEVTVAPFPLRLGARIPMAFPGVLHLGLTRRFASSSGITDAGDEG